MAATHNKTPTARTSLRRHSSLRLAVRGCEKRLSDSRFVKLRHIIPIDEMIDKGLQVIRSPVSIIDVIGMFPDVATKNGFAAMHERVLAIGCFHDLDFSVLDRE